MSSDQSKFASLFSSAFAKKKKSTDDEPGSEKKRSKSLIMNQLVNEVTVPGWKFPWLGTKDRHRDDDQVITAW